MDETNLKIKGGGSTCVQPIDSDSKEILAAYSSSYYRSHINTLAFLRKVKETVHQPQADRTR